MLCLHKSPTVTRCQEEMWVFRVDADTSNLMVAQSVPPRPGRFAFSQVEMSKTPEGV